MEYEDDLLSSFYPLYIFLLAWDSQGAVRMDFLFFLADSLEHWYIFCNLFHVMRLILGVVKISPHDLSSTFPPTNSYLLLFELWTSDFL